MKRFVARFSLFCFLISPPLQASFFGTCGSGSVISSMPSGVYDGEVPPWPAGQTAGFGFTASPNTGFFYDDDGSHRIFGFAVNGVEGFRIRQDYLTQPNDPFLVAHRIYSDSAHQSTSFVGTSSSPYAEGHYTTLYTYGAQSFQTGLFGANLSGRAFFLKPSDMSSDAGIGFNFTTGKEWSFLTKDGTDSSTFLISADTDGSSTRQFTIGPNKIPAGTEHGEHFFLKGGDTDGSGAGGDVIVQPGTGAAGGGHFFVPSVAGTPSGTPGTHSGFTAVKYDTTNHKLCAYDGGGWKCSAAFN